MWKFLHFIGSLVKAVFWLAMVFALTTVVLLYVLKQNVPAPLLHRLADALSSDDYLFRIGRASYSLKSGLHLYQVKAFPKRVVDTALLSADEITLDVSLLPQLPMSDRIRGITVRNISMPSLPPKHGTNSAARTEIRLPTLAPFPLTVEKANILGIKAERLSATVAMENPQISVTDVTILWPDKEFTMSIAGYVTLNLSTRLVDGDVKGQAFPANILPLLVALHSRAAVKHVNSFSKIERPVNAEAAFTVNIDNTDFSLLLSLDVGPCDYRSVPMKYAKGTLGAYGTNIYTTVVVGPLQAESATGPLAGKLVYREENESVEFDATASMDVHELATVVDILQHGELKPIACDIPPTVTAKGLVSADRVKSPITNDITGHIDFPAGSIFRMPVKNVTSDFAVKGDSALFDSVCGSSASGGKIAGNIAFFFPGGAATSTLFTTRATFAGVNLSDVERTFNLSTNARAGLVSGSVSLVGRAGNRTAASLAGDGKLRISDGVLSRMPLFAGFTDYLARTVPGVSALVNQSSGSMNFTIEDGVLSTENLLIEGDLFSMQGRGTCNLDTEALDFLVRANIFKERTWAGRITRLVTMPFTRLLLEFKVFGTLDKTDWSYVNIIEQIADSLTDISGQRKEQKTSAEQPPKLSPAP